MTRIMISYVNLFEGGPTPRCTAHVSIGAAASEVAAADDPGHYLGTLRIEIGAHGIVNCQPIDPALRGVPAAAAVRPSSRMLGLIAEYRRWTAALDAIDCGERPHEWDAVADRRCRALDALLAERSASVADHCAKYTALMGFFPEDFELVSLGILADEARLLAGAASGVPAGAAG